MIQGCVPLYYYTILPQGPVQNENKSQRGLLRFESTSCNAWIKLELKYDI